MVDAVDAEIAKHAERLRDVPITYDAAVAGAIVYLGLLINGFHATPVELKVVMSAAARLELVGVTQIPPAAGRPWDRDDEIEVHVRSGPLSEEQRRALEVAKEHYVVRYVAEC